MSNTAQCPVCGKTITKEQFLKQKICPNPMCGSELDDEEEIYEAFGIPMDNEAEANKEDVDLLEQLIQGSRYQKVDRQRKAQDVSSFLNGSSAASKDTPKSNEPSEKAAERKIQTQNNIQANNSAVNESFINKSPEEEFVKTESHPDTSRSENTNSNADVLAEKDKTIAMLLEKIESMNKEQNGNGSQGSSNSEVISNNTIADDKTVDEQQVYNNNDVDYHEVNQSVNEMLKENPFKLKADTIENDEQPTVDTSSVLDNTLETTSHEELPDPHDVKADSEKNEVIEEKELSSADKLRMRLKGNRNSQSNEDIDKAVEEKYVAEHRENVSEDYNSNYDGYYDDTESEVPPEPDVINIGTIRRAVIAVVVIVVFSAFLIYYV